MNRRYYIAIRGVLDRLLAVVLMLVLAPAMGVIAVNVRLRLGAPVLFRQKRVGRYGREFEILKFRTMIHDAEKLGGGYFSADLELTPPFGAFLRKTSLDELPQLVNIARGDMGFVGPRPALPAHFHRYTPRQALRVRVPQGITGLAQVRYRNNAPWSVRIAADLEYIESIGFMTDVRICALTLVRVLRAEGVRLDQTAADVDDLDSSPTEEGGHHA